jgi:hypothetical protein
VQRITVQIAGKNLWRRELEQFVGSNRLYLKGTDASRYVDCRDRAEADLVVANLNYLPGVQARILGG